MGRASCTRAAEAIEGRLVGPPTAEGAVPMGVAAVLAPSCAPASALAAPAAPLPARVPRAG